MYMYKFSCTTQYLLISKAVLHNWMNFLDNLNKKAVVLSFIDIHIKCMYLKTNIFTFFVAVKPKDKIIHSFSL